MIDEKVQERHLLMIWQRGFTKLNEMVQLRMTQWLIGMATRECGSQYASIFCDQDHACSSHPDRLLSMKENATAANWKDRMGLQDDIGLSTPSYSAARTDALAGRTIWHECCEKAEIFLAQSSTSRMGFDMSGVAFIVGGQLLTQESGTPAEHYGGSAGSVLAHHVTSLAERP